MLYNGNICTYRSKSLQKRINENKNHYCCVLLCVRSDLCAYKPAPWFDKFCFEFFKVGLYASIYGIITFIITSTIIVLATGSEKEQHLLCHSIILFTFVLLHLQFCVYTIPRFCFFPNITIQLCVTMTPFVRHNDSRRAYSNNSESDVCEFCRGRSQASWRCVSIMVLVFCPDP